MTEEKELEVWRKEWESLGGKEDVTKFVMARVAKDGRRIKLGIAGEVAASIVASSFALFMAIKSHGAPVTTVLCAAIFLFCGVWLTRLFTLREAAALGEGLDGFLSLTRKRFEDDLRWNDFSWRTCIVVSVASTAWGSWALAAGWSLYRAEPWRGIVGFGGIYVILGFVVAMLRSKRAKIKSEREAFESLVASSLVDE